MMGAREVMVTYNTEVIIYDGTRIHSAPFSARSLSGRTGRGDTCFAAYLACRLSMGIDKAVQYAAALTSIKMEIPGPFMGSKQDVYQRMEKAK
jgi:sugar/nucleoside kinase (ribokinase family)